MRGNEVFTILVNGQSDIFDEALQANGINQSDIKWLVPHQANKRIIDAAAKKLNISII